MSVLVVCSRLSLIRCARAQTSTGSSGGVQPARASVPAVRTAPSSSGSMDISSSSAPADVGSSSPDGSSQPSSAAVAVETHVAQACSGSHGVSSLASAESSSSAPSNSVVTREVLEELLMEMGAESSERVIAGPRLEQLGRLAVGLQVALVGFSRESISRQIQVDPALTVSEISAGWDSDFRGPASPDLAQDDSSATPRLATSIDTLVAPSTEAPDHLIFLAQVSAAAEIAGEDGGDASEGS
ncbi:unnamed protein product [Phytophthora lilii]|uniref:Unnamed protein product n=1 Tax=Phytophthora lilii TaxID=2077276 RepID=A0A9W6YKK0_9STRA|nr:unnamed protein product [Phytophthora lilii]